MATSEMALFRVGHVEIHPVVESGWLRSLGRVTVDGVALRRDVTRFLPWFDTLEGEVFRQFRCRGIEQRGPTTVIRTTAVSDPDVMFRERRDSSGDPCFRERSWDDAPVEAELNICFQSAAQDIGGHEFHGLRYWFEYRGDETQIHRLVDRQTWELGGNLDNVNLVLRNWLTAPRLRLRRESNYSTIGLDKWATLLPGNLWGRWSLLPSFDMQYAHDSDVGGSGVLLAWFDRVSLIRTVIETAAGEDGLRCRDMHLFAQSAEVDTNAKTVLYCGDALDHVDAMNLWTRILDRENERARTQFDIPPEPPPKIGFFKTQWVGYHYDRTYDDLVDTAAEFECDMIFVDPPWEHQEAIRQELESLLPESDRAGRAIGKWVLSNMCETHDFELAQAMGGETALKALVERARARGLDVISWMATHYSPDTTLARDPSLAYGRHGMSIYAVRESGCHPDTGYAGACWTANLNSPVFDKLRQQILNACRRTGLGGFLWDSFCNLGWWQIDYASGDMRPQFDRMMQLYADLVRAGLYIMPEAIVTFSNHSCCGLHGGNVYASDLLGYSYNTNISLQYDGDDPDQPQPHVDWSIKVLRGEAPFALLFACFAHKRVPGIELRHSPRDSWDPVAVQRVKELFRIYRSCRHLMCRRTVLKQGLGVRWDNDKGRPLLFAFREHTADHTLIDAATGEKVPDRRAAADRVYFLQA